jgi:hypothetical protein
MLRPFVATSKVRVCAIPPLAPARAKRFEPLPVYVIFGCKNGIY